MARLTNREMRNAVLAKLEFQNNGKTCWGEWINDTQYVVYSYRESWPLIIYDKKYDIWFENRDKYSNTTTRHLTYASPHKSETRFVSVHEAILITTFGTTYWLTAKVGGSAAAREAMIAEATDQAVAHANRVLAT